MALPVSPAPKSHDVVVRSWAGITVRVAWTLLSMGVKVRPDVLEAARTHALFHIAPSTLQPHAEDIAAHCTEGFIAQARGKRPERRWSQDAELSLSPRWRRAVERSIDATGEAVFRKHYGDNRSLSHLEHSLGIDRITLEAARGGLREMIRRAALNDGLPLQDWPPERLDRLLKRLAAWSAGPCPPPLDLVEGAHREHVRNCARCDRLVRLVRASILRLEDLLPPSIRARPRGEVRVLAIHFHPEGRQHRPALAKELGTRCFPLGDDLLILDADALEEVEVVVRTATEISAPHRDLLRGVIVEGPGAWSTHGLLGPMVANAERMVRHRGWGHIERMAELPEPLPTPPSARWAWAANAALAAAAAGLAFLVWNPSPATAKTQLQLDFAPTAQGVWASFDVPDEDYLTVVARRGGALELISAPLSAASKAELAVGDGSYRVHTDGEALLVARTSEPLPQLEELMAQCGEGEGSLQALAHLLRERAPDADVRTSPPMP